MQPGKVGQPRLAVLVTVLLAARRNLSLKFHSRLTAGNRKRGKFVL